MCGWLWSPWVSFFIWKKPQPREPTRVPSVRFEFDITRLKMDEVRVQPPGPVRCEGDGLNQPHDGGNGIEQVGLRESSAKSWSRPVSS